MENEENKEKLAFILDFLTTKFEYVPKLLKGEADFKKYLKNLVKAKKISQYESDELFDYYWGNFTYGIELLISSPELHFILKNKK